MPLQVVQVRNDLLGKLGIEDPTTAPAIALDDCVIALNAAMQILQTAGEDYFTRQTLSQNISAGTASYMIAQSVQAILGPIRLASTPLMALESQGQYDQYARIFGGATAFGQGSGTPKAYHVQNLRNGTIGDINRIFIWLAPIPDAFGILSIDVVNDAPGYVVADLSSTAVVPIAQSYTESILLPIARFFITRSTLFSRQELLKPLTADYQEAMRRLGLSGGFPNVDQQLPRREVKA
jgi:hypothetical protein